jgi:DNA polymerase-1
MPNLKTKNGIPTAVIKALMTYIKSILTKDFDYIVFASESKNSYRKNIYPEYKANREETPEELKSQITTSLYLLEKMGFTVIESEGYEADDVIASFAKKFSEAGASVQIDSSDKDLFQLISDNVYIYNPLKKEIYNKSGCVEKLGVEPNQVRDFLTLTGDTSDNIPGLKGVGPKTATKLLTEYKSLGNIYAHIEELKQSLSIKLRDNKEILRTSWRLVSLYDYLAEDIDLREFKTPKNVFSLIREDLEKLEIQG